MKLAVFREPRPTKIVAYTRATFAICYRLFVIPGKPKASPARHGFPLTQPL
jgi:hypothetical protein